MTIYDEIDRELARAYEKFPFWPTRALDAIGVVNEEVGELNKDVLQYTYEPAKTNPDNIRAEAVQAAAMMIRFIRSLDRYDYTPGGQHDQSDCR